MAATFGKLENLILQPVKIGYSTFNELKWKDKQRGYKTGYFDLWLDQFLLQESTVILCSHSGENQEVKGDRTHKEDCGREILQTASCHSGWNDNWQLVTGNWQFWIHFTRLYHNPLQWIKLVNTFIQCFKHQICQLLICHRSILR